PSGPPRSASVSTSARGTAPPRAPDADGRARPARNRPARRRSTRPSAEATASAATSAISPPVTPMSQSREYTAPARRHPFPRAGAAPAQVGLAVSRTFLSAVIWKLLIGAAVAAIEPAYLTVPSSLAVVQAATWVRAPLGWTTHSWQVVPTGMWSTR